MFSSIMEIPYMAAWMAFLELRMECVFIIDELITLPTAVFGFMFVPDLHETTKRSCLSIEGRNLVLSRLPRKADA